MGHVYYSRQNSQSQGIFAYLLLKCVPASIDTRLGPCSGRCLGPRTRPLQSRVCRGRTAAEHWDLTEQIFKDIVVITGQAIRQKRQTRQGFEFTLKHLSADKIFGIKPVWRHHTKVPVSDVHRTVIDMLDDPAIGGGIQHVADCLKAYLTRADRSDQKLIEYGERLGNGAVFKRLGFLAERQPTDQGLPSYAVTDLKPAIQSLIPRSIPDVLSHVGAC
jgi:hypothetical protein